MCVTLSTLLVVAMLFINAVLSHAQDVEGMKAKCQARAASALRVPEGTVSVKYEGQRTDKTHAVNGSADVGGKTRTFQCSFASDGIRIAKFIVNPAESRGAPAASAGADKEAEATGRAGEGRFDANGSVPCAQYKGQPMRDCKFGVARAGGGSATVVVTLPDGRKRVIFFRKGKAVGADTSQADGNAPFRVTKESDLFMIRVGDERFEIPEAVVFGG